MRRERVMRMNMKWNVSWLRCISVPLTLGAALTQTTVALAAAISSQPTLAHAGVPMHPPGMAATAFPQGPLAVTYQQGRLSVRAERVPLAQILQEVSRQTGLTIQGLASMQQEVSAQFDDLPLPDGLRRLLVRVNYLLLIEHSAPGEPPRLQALVFGRDTTPPVEYLREPARTSSRKGTASEELEQALADTDPFRRRWAVERLGEWGDAQAFPRLHAALDDADPGVRQGALASLSPYGERALGPLQALLQHERDPTVRLVALQVLGQVGREDEATGALLHEMLADHDPRIRAAVVEALGSVEGPRATDVLQAVARDGDPHVRLAALRALALYARDTSARAAVEQHLDDTDEAVRDGAAALLGMFTE
jgi:hypothetical protein